MSWVIFLAVLVAWSLIGLGVAYLFGRFVGGVESAENPGVLIPPVLSYLRPKKNSTASPRPRAPNQTKARREAVGRHRVS